MCSIGSSISSSMLNQHAWYEELLSADNMIDLSRVTTAKILPGSETVVSFADLGTGLQSLPYKLSLSLKVTPG